MKESPLLTIVRECMSDGTFWTLADLAARAKCSTQTASARVRDLRKRQFGAHTVIRQRVCNGTFLYKLEMTA